MNSVLNSSLMHRELGTSKPLARCVENTRRTNLEQGISKKSLLDSNLFPISAFDVQGTVCAIHSEQEIKFWGWEERVHKLIAWCYDLGASASYKLGKDFFRLVEDKLVYSQTTSERKKIVKIIDFKTSKYLSITGCNSKKICLVRLVGNRVFGVLDGGTVAEWDFAGGTVSLCNLREKFPAPDLSEFIHSKRLDDKQLHHSSDFFVYINTPRIYFLNLHKNKWDHFDLPKQLKIHEITAAFLGRHQLFLGVLKRKSKKLRAKIAIFDLLKGGKNYKSLPFYPDAAIKEIKQEQENLFARVKKIIYALDLESGKISPLGSSRCSKREDAMEILDGKLLAVKEFINRSSSYETDLEDKFKIFDAQTCAKITDITLPFTYRHARHIVNREGRVFLNSGVLLVQHDYNVFGELSK